MKNSNNRSRRKISYIFSIENLERRDCPAVIVYATGYSAFEGEPAKFEVSLSEAARFPVTVQYSTQDGSAKSGSDYVAKSGTLLFPKGTKTLIVPVSTLSDDIIEKGEKINFNLGTVTNAILGDQSTTATIVDMTNSTKVSFLKSGAIPASVQLSYRLKDSTGKIKSIFSYMDMGSLTASHSMALYDYNKAESDVKIAITLKTSGKFFQFSLSKKDTYYFRVTGNGYNTPWGVTCI